jgi:hypothetical protein
MKILSCKLHYMIVDPIKSNKTMCKYALVLGTAAVGNVLG